MNDDRAKILIVDDEESIRNIIYRKLQAEGYSCTVASGGEEALQTASTGNFDLLLSDVKMPGISGIELLSQMMVLHPDIGVIMITAVSDAHTAVEAMKLGAFDYVTKPFDLNALTARVEKALERRRLIIENMQYQNQLEKKVEEQVGEIRTYYREAIEALAREEMALERLNTSQRSKNQMLGFKLDIHDSHECSGVAKEFADKLAQPCNDEERPDFESTHMEMARLLAQITETREPYANGHSEGVCQLAREIALQLDCTPELIRDIRIASIVHDIGKVVIPDKILFKPGILTDEERNEVKKHPKASVEMLQGDKYFERVLPLVESHHEWFNGEGYPNGLKGEDIPLGARIIAVADAYEAMTCPRPHRDLLSHGEAVQALMEGAGKQWDPRVVNAFLQVLERETRMLQRSVAR